MTGEGEAALKQLRALPAEKLVEGVSGAATLKALSAGATPPGMAMSIIDGRFLPETPESALAAGRQAVVPVIIGANDRELAIGSASTKYELFEQFSQSMQCWQLFRPREPRQCKLSEHCTQRTQKLQRIRRSESVQKVQESHATQRSQATQDSFSRSRPMPASRPNTARRWITRPRMTVWP